MITKGILIAVGKVVGTCLLSGCLFWQIALRAGPRTNEVVVHVTEYPAVVTIDGQSYRVANRWGTPFVCVLRAGWHEYQMRRGNRLVAREKFLVRLGENLTVTVQDPHRRAVESTPPR